MRNVTSRWRVRAALVVLAPLALSGCSSKQAARGSGEVTAVLQDGVQVAELKGTDTLVFDPATVKAKPGKVKLILTVTGAIPHNLEVDGIRGAAIDNVPGHERADVTFTATAGDYRLICTYHPGMRGRLLVSP